MFLYNDKKENIRKRNLQISLPFVELKIEGMLESQFFFGAEEEKLTTETYKERNTS